ncbi:MAG TPA: carboxypeptidase regulatory-like domain-containing protein [Vicinamibacterales bacterium]|nr:carboxypeptidase regulatory-like domain-containing protein [Vicinamibacterales bacterium]
MRRTVNGTIVFCFWLAASSPSFAQTFGQITGIVADTTGGVLVGASVTVTNTQTAATVTQPANAAGVYVFPNLLPGVYSIKVEMDGFRSTVRNRVELQIQQTIRLDFRLEIGALNETVEAVAAGPMLNTEDVVIGTVIENRRIVELPLNGRNFLKMVELTPNVSASFVGSGSSGPRQGGDRSSQQLSIGGGRREWNYFTLDGINNTDVNFNSYIFLPSIDALQEFKVQTGIYSAEFGRELGQVSVTTKAGTNAYHGTLFEFIRDSKWDALPYAFAGNVPTSTPFNWNQFGFTLGGPVQIPRWFDGKDKLFFMGNYEGFRLRNQKQTVYSVPSVAMRNGDFSQISTALRDPLTNAPFPDNIVPKERISPISRALLDYYPAPNQATSSLANNYLAVNQDSTDKHQFTSRVDFTESSKSTWYGRYSWTDESIDTGGLKLNGTIVSTNAHQVVLDNARVVTTTLVNEMRVGFNSFFNHSGGELNNVFDPIAEIGIPLPTQIPPDAWGLPSIGIAGFSGFGDNSESPFVNRNNNWQFIDNLSWTRGSHFVKFGGELRLDHYNQDGNQFARGSAGFNNNIATGYGFADFLLGYIGSWSYASGLAQARLHAVSQAYYVNDTWKIKPKVTINVGLRYELTPPWTDSLQRQIVADIPLNTPRPQVADLSLHPVLVRAGNGDFYQNANIKFSPDIQIARDGRFGDRPIKADYTNFAPRFGVAWSPTSRWVVRAGAGRFFVQDIGNIVFDKNRNLNGRLTVQSTATNLISTWQDPFNFGGANPCNTPPGVLCVVRPLVLTDQIDRKTPYVDQYETTVERQLTDTTALEVSYLGTQGHRLQRWINLANQPVPGTAPVADRSPFPEFGLFQGAANVGYSDYNALGVKVTRRYSEGLTVLGSYTFSKSTDNGSGIRTLGTDPLNPQNSYCLPCEDGLSVFDQRHRFVTSAVYDLPFGFGRRYLNDGALSKVIGGWKVTSVVTFASGFPLTVSAGEDTANIGNCCRPNRDFNVGTAIDQPTIEKWFNTAAYSRAPNGTFGTAGRSEVIGPGIENWDFSMSKGFHFGRQRYLEFRFEAFNFLNHPNWGEPNTTLSSVAFGRISSTRTDMRQLQFGLKFVF